MKKLKLISLLCSLIMVLSCFSVFPAFAAEPETSYKHEGSGTANDPYVLTNANFADFMNQAKTANAFKTTSFRLGEDIILNNGANDGTAEDWAAGTVTPTLVLDRPIINYDYDAVFDGDGHTISGICMIAGEGIADVGLFKYLSYGADGTCVKNLRLVNSYFASQSTTASTMGSIAARLYYNAQVTNCYSEAILTNTKAAEATSKVDGVVIGGIVGATGQVNPNASLYPTISNCVFAGSILNNIGDTGGILGSVPYNVPSDQSGKTAKVTINNCLNLGSVNSTVQNTNVSAILGSPNWQYVTVTISKCMNLSTNVPNELLGNGNIGSISVSDYYVVNGLRAKNDYVFPGNTSNWAQGRTLSAFLNEGVNGWTVKPGYVPNPTTFDIPLTAIINADTLGLKTTGDVTSVRISTENKGLRFETFVSDNGVNLLAELKKVEGATVAMNTYISAGKYFTGENAITTFTADALGADRYLKVTATEYLRKNGENGEEVNTFAGSVVKINDVTMDYIAVGCVTVTIGDTTYDIYADWSTEEITSVKAVATIAANDTQTEAGVAGYDKQITDINGATAYSPYTQKQYDIIVSLTKNA